jgi:hypothetical protein
MKSILAFILVALYLAVSALTTGSYVSADSERIPDAQVTEDDDKPRYRWTLVEGRTVLEFKVLTELFHIPTRMIAGQPRRFPLELVIEWPKKTAWRNRRTANVDRADLNADRLFISISEKDLSKTSTRKLPYPIEWGLKHGQLEPAEQRPGTTFLDCYPLKTTGHCMYYVSNDGTQDANGSPIALVCGPPTGETSYKYRRCSVSYQIAAGVKAHYNFYDKHIGDWESIHETVSELLVSRED